MVGHTSETRAATHRSFDIVEGGLLRRIRGEYREMPSLQLSIEQAMRLWSLNRATCAAVLDALVESGFLQVDDRGRYTRTHCGY